MDLIGIYERYPTHEQCIKHLERIKWNNTPTCPYCNSNNFSPAPSENRFHCNTCNTSFSVTVGTIFHKTKVDLQKWFFAISYAIGGKSKISSRQLAAEISVTKDTAWLMLTRIRNAYVQQRQLLHKIVQWDQ